MNNWRKKEPLVISLLNSSISSLALPVNFSWVDAEFPNTQSWLTDKHLCDIDSNNVQTVGMQNRLSSKWGHCLITESPGHLLEQ